MVLKLLKNTNYYIYMLKYHKGSILKQKHFSALPPNFQMCDNQTPSDGFSSL